ncbi:MAG TPA: AzlD domain-containing protein [Alphaproteobacteria bacterium]|nr:AzlD domain-containing protein [Alphaproteobacteria bacterium]
MFARPDILLAIALLGVVSMLCRFGGFFLMRYVAITPRVDAWLRAMPVALVGAIIGPVAVKGGPPEWLGLAAAVGLMRWTGNEFIACAVAIAGVAGARLVLS